MRGDETVLVTAAAGGTGQFVVQLAKAAGNHVVATCGGSEKAALLKKLGADRVSLFQSCCAPFVRERSIILALSLIFASRKANLGKTSAYDCGFDPLDDARSRFDIQFHLVATLFAGVTVYLSPKQHTWPWCMTCHLHLRCILRNARPAAQGTSMMRLARCAGHQLPRGEREGGAEEGVQEGGFISLLLVHATVFGGLVDAVFQRLTTLV